MKLSQRNPVSRLLHAKNDKETIANWRLDLNRILHVFNVRSVEFVPLTLTAPLQTELAVSAHIMIAELVREASNQEGTDGQHHSVSSTSHPSTTERLPSPRLKPGWSP